MVREWSKAGAYHHNKSEENQDAVLYGANQRFSVIALADGVSSCREAKSGARIACEAVTELLLKKGGYFLEFEKEKRAEFAVSHILYKLKKKSQESGGSTEEYSSTIAGVLLDKKAEKLLILNLGDSLILTVKKGECLILSMPSDSASGCCVTTTENASLMVRTDVIDAAGLESILICSDGAWSHMFEKNVLRQEVKMAITGNDYDRLGRYLELQNGFDDYSFISIDLHDVNGGKRHG